MKEVGVGCWYFGEAYSYSKVHARCCDSLGSKPDALALELTNLESGGWFDDDAF